MANTYSTKIDFGTIGIKIGDTINFIRDPSITYKVGSGNGTPDNGGTLLIDEDNGSLSSITVITKKLMGKDFNTDMDVETGARMLESRGHCGFRDILSIW